MIIQATGDGAGTKELAVEVAKSEIHLLVKSIVVLKKAQASKSLDLYSSLSCMTSVLSVLYFPLLQTGDINSTQLIGLFPDLSDIMHVNDSIKYLAHRKQSINIMIAICIQKAS